MQDTINHAFPGSTMLAVAHRLETIMEFRPWVAVAHTVALEYLFGEIRS